MGDAYHIDDARRNPSGSENDDHLSIERMSSRHSAKESKRFRRLGPLGSD
jgi:hypothetical protein